MLDILIDSNYSTIVQELIPDEDGIITINEKTVGIIRIWNISTQNPTNYYILIGEYDSSASSLINIDSISWNYMLEINNAINTIFLNAKTSISQYSLLHRVNLDIFLNAQLIQDIFGN